MPNDLQWSYLLVSGCRDDNEFSCQDPGVSQNTKRLPRLQGVYCNAHRSYDGCWISADRVERTPEGRIKAYVARHGHGTYPQVMDHTPLGEE
jgi:hypothetical protein